VAGDGADEHGDVAFRREGMVGMIGRARHPAVGSEDLRDAPGSVERPPVFARLVGPGRPGKGLAERDREAQGQPAAWSRALADPAEQGARRLVRQVRQYAFTAEQAHLPRLERGLSQHVGNVRGGEVGGGELYVRDVDAERFQAPKLVGLGGRQVHLDVADARRPEPQRPAVVAGTQDDNLSCPAAQRAEQFGVEEFGARRDEPLERRPLSGEGCVQAVLRLRVAAGSTRTGQAGADPGDLMSRCRRQRAALRQYRR
jgi:hypothetical protein